MGRFVIRRLLRLALVGSALSLAALVGLFLYGARLAGDLGLDRAEIAARARAVEASLVPSQAAGPGGRSFDAAMELPLSLSGERIPEFVKNIVVAQEDRQFRAWWHLPWNAISPLRHLPETIIAAARGEKLTGGSTITVQLVKNLLLSPEQTLPNKLRQVALALYIETLFSKDEILTMYLNTAPFGDGVHGIEAAARHYFGRSVGYQPAVDGYEAALLIGSVQTPSYVNPGRNRDVLEAKAARVLAAMAAAGVDAGPPGGTRSRGERVWAISPYLFRDVALRSLFPSTLRALTDRVSVMLTVDTEAQLYAEREAASLLAAGRPKGYDSSAIIVLERDGAIAALATGQSYDGIDLVDGGRVSPGSTLKPFLALCALEHGMTPASEVHDVRHEFRRGWAPANFDHSWMGTISLRTALMRSRNPPMIELYDRFGAGCFAGVLARFGIVLDRPQEPTAVLGSEPVSLLALAGAYASLASGHRVEPYAVRYIRGLGGEPLFRHAAPPAAPIAGGRAYCDLMGMLRGVATAEGTGKNAAFAHPVWGKTGTSSGERDALFVGFTGHYVAVVWLGRQAPGKPSVGVTGGSLPAEHFRSLMATLHQGKPVVDLDCGMMVADSG